MNSSPAIRLGVSGACGRMGLRVIALATTDDRFRLVAALEGDGHPNLGRDAGEPAGLGPIGLAISNRLPTSLDALVDFSTPAATLELAAQCAELGAAFVSGTTGLSPEQEKQVAAAAEAVPVLRAANFSIGINIMLGIVRDAVRTAGEEFDIEVIETHHRKKVDAPSGTALALARAAAQAAGSDPEKDFVYGRSGKTGRKPGGEIGIHAVRSGGTVGEHVVLLGSETERIEIGHRAYSRDVFAAGALRAAAFIAGKPPGIYSFAQVLGLPGSA